jgi:cytidylate kinase
MGVVFNGDLSPLDPSLLPRNAVVAIDGPAGSGKSTTARALADIFDLLYIDTGAMYRALTQAALSAGIDPGDQDGLAAMLKPARLELKPAKGDVSVLWNGKDVSRAIRTPQVEAAVSRVSSHPAVRTNMVERQKALGRQGGVVMEGRDIGSVVFPLATAKIFLSASLEARVDRRFRQYQQRGLDVSRQELHLDLAERDRQDRERATSPLAISPDAVVIDSSDLSLEQQNLLCARSCLINPTLDLELDTDLETALREIPPQYRLAYCVFCALARFYGLKQFGNEGGALPRGCIVAVNHVSTWDPPLMGATLHRFPVHTLAKAELFKIWPIGSFFRWIDSIPIQRSGFDAEAFAEAITRLDEGHNVLIFPEGTRRAIGHPGPVRNGLGILVQATNAPTLPIFVRGTYGRKPGGSVDSPLEIHFGPMIRWHGLPALSRDLGKKEISRRIADLCEAAFWELQARSFAANPQTDFEKELGAKQLKKFARRQAQVFGR